NGADWPGRWQVAQWEKTMGAMSLWNVTVPRGRVRYSPVAPFASCPSHTAAPATTSPTKQTTVGGAAFAGLARPARFDEPRSLQSLRRFFILVLFPGRRRHDHCSMARPLFQGKFSNPR